MNDRHNSLSILLVNYRFFVSGGPERYLFNFVKLLEEKGHQIIPFSVKHPKNQSTEYSEFFLSPITSDENSVLLSQLRKNPRTLVRLFGRVFYSLEAKKNVKAIVDRADVNIAYCLNFLRWISPSFITELYRARVPIIVRISDFSYICPEAHLLRDGRVCELCTKGRFSHSVRYKCVCNSFLLSFINFLSILLHKQLKLLDKIDAFVCPSQFTLERMAKAGFEKQKLFHVPTFVDSERIIPKFEPGNYILYFGRISHEKGIGVLLDAYEKLKGNKSKDSMPLYIVGKSYGKETEQLKKRIHLSGNKKVKVLDEVEKDQLFQIVGNSAFTIVPSIWYENMPNAILESFANGKPVVGSRIGSIPELVKHGETGLLFEPGDSDALAEKMQWMIDHPEDCSRMGQNARALVEKKYNPELHYKGLMEIFESFHPKHDKCIS
ncbi:MAG: hypothetical protein CEE38_20565 [Planctomycetes bacterium B3_Pla]|nr:MAG: hypothetical protein CEE38_20565 [Planctomycetes bacterium B3_Pla]